MTEEEIRRIAREECNQVMSEFGLTDHDVIIKTNQTMSEQECAQYGFTYLTVFKRIGEIAIMVGKKGVKVIKIVVFMLGVWQATQFGSMFLFEKELPDALDLTKRAREGIIEFSYDIRDQSPTTPESWVVTSPSWESYDDSQYYKSVYDYLAGIRRPEELYVKDTLFIPTSTMTIEALQGTSGNFEDFEV